MGTKRKSEWSEERIQNTLRQHFLSSSSKKYEMFNLFVYDWESDYLAITKSGYAYEVEIKISRNDFKNEEKHKAKKRLLLEGWDKHAYRPNYFYYAVPEGLLAIEEIPENCGLIYVRPYGITIVKQAPKLHDEKADIDGLKLIDKFYYNMWSWRDKWVKTNSQVSQEHMKALEKEVIWYDDELSRLNGEIDCLKLELKKHETEQG